MKKILIVEDNADNRDLVIQTLEYDYEIVVAVDGRQALERAADSRPDLILMDLSLPIMDGWEAARRLKADGELQKIPIIALSSHAMAGTEEKARAVGCDDYLSKPVSPAFLLDKIAEWLGGADNT